MDRFRLWRGAFPVGEQQVPGPDQGGCERIDVGVCRDAAKLPLDGQVRGDHGRGLRHDRQTGQPGLA
jgi:hypothetical protein